ncbi:hypothetical protein GFS24_28105 [Chitinophaga sp. SYP-B3965]|uniref:prenyltransferase/squalene oxidase repeat-containing protein n=1 Tax=Chitinophaga sp. SYP-B3965 TaxID=2663120 RepID=UPI001299E9C3|nr:prenyltransferase/squalene oxidase repeat-containing protein [Chitinophaga sp. SYP-B3965]MRG49005.1 hypothetical protein [Chitinophaga sp. SYP-B3965]
MKKSIKKAEIDFTVMEALKNIKSHYRQDKKIDAIATAQVLLAFKYFRADFNDKLNVEESLLNDQIKSPGNSRGYAGWGDVTNFYKMANTEATCMALLALHDEYGNDPRIQAGLNWLMKSAIRCLRDEGWGIMPGDISRVYTTCLALKTLKEYGKANTYEYERGLNWLIKVQNPDKGWGSKPGDTSNITYTSRVIITLTSIGYDVNNENLKSAVQWLKGQTRSVVQTKWNIKYEYKESILFRGRELVFHHMPVQTVFIALILSGNTKSFTVFDGVNELIKYNNDYFWTHPSFEDGTRKPLWAIFDTLMVCKALQDTTHNWPSTKIIQTNGHTLSYIYAGHPCLFGVLGGKESGCTRLLIQPLLDWLKVSWRK